MMSMIHHEPLDWVKISGGAPMSQIVQECISLLPRDNASQSVQDSILSDQLAELEAMVVATTNTSGGESSIGLELSRACSEIRLISWLASQLRTRKKASWSTLQTPSNDVSDESERQKTFYKSTSIILLTINLSKTMVKLAWINHFLPIAKEVVNEQMIMLFEAGMYAHHDGSLDSPFVSTHISELSSTSPLRPIPEAKSHFRSSIVRHLLRLGE